MGTVPAERCAPCLPCLACPNGSRQIIPWGLLHLHKTIRSLLVLQVPKTHHLDSLTPGLTFKFRVSSPSLSSPFRLSRCHWNQHGCTRALQSQFLSSNYWWLHLTASNYVSLEKQMSEPWVWSQIIKDAMPYVDVRQEVSFLGDIMDLYTHTGNLSQMNSLHVNGFLIIERRPRLNFLRYFFPNSLSTGNSTSGNKCFFKRKGLGSHHPSLSAAVVQWCWKRGWDKRQRFLKDSRARVCYDRLESQHFFFLITQNPPPPTPPRHKPICCGQFRSWRLETRATPVKTCHTPLDTQDTLSLCQD